MNDQEKNQLPQLKQDAEEAINVAQWEQAKLILDQITQIDDSDFYVWHQLGYCHMMLNDVLQAKSCLSKSIAINPGFEHTYIVLSHAYVQEKNFPMAIGILQQLVERFPESAEGYSLLGGAYMFNNQFSDAEKHLSKSLNLNPALNNTRLHLSSLLMQMCNYDSAISQLKILLETGEYSGEAHSLLGDAYCFIEDCDNAIIHYELAVELMPDVEGIAANLEVARGKRQLKDGNDMMN